MTAISIKNLEKVYKSKKSGDKVALSGINLEVEEGAFFGLLGPNGAGKSTLINILSSVVTKTNGEVSVFGYDLDKQNKEVKKSIGVVPQELVLDPFFSVRQVLDNTAGYYGIRAKDRITDQIIEVMGLKDKAGTNSRKLSGGMLRRLLVAKAMVHSPKLLILDEPTAGVDVELRQQLWDYIVKLNKQGTTILLTTHYLQEAEELCDRIAVINNGQIIANDNKNTLLKMLDRKRIIITSDKKITEIPDSLRQFTVKINDLGQIEVEYHTRKTKISDILSAIAMANIIISDISTKESDLEDVFRFLTKK